MITLNHLGERNWIKHMSAALPTRPDVVEGVGDDCAVVSTGGAHDWLLTSDAVIEGVNFDTGTAYQRIGHKALARALSDIAAMGGEPRWALIDLVIPPDVELVCVDDLYSGINALAAKHQVAIVGGDTAHASQLEIHVFLTGCVPTGRFIRRSGAQVGDGLWVTGRLGGSRSGHHLDFEPRMAEGRFLREWATSMIDISDGLAIDASHLAIMSNVGFLIRADDLPLRQELRKTVPYPTAIDHALYDGEDFELLFTVPAKRTLAFQSAWSHAGLCPLTRIGTASMDAGLVCLQMADGSIQACKAEGYDHFQHGG